MTQRDAKKTTMKASSGRRRTIPAILFEFRQPDVMEPPLLVLATYLVNGRYFQSQAALTRYNGRGPNLSAERPPYLTRILIDDVLSIDGLRKLWMRMKRF